MLRSSHCVSDYISNENWSLKVDEDSTWRDVLLWKENIRECMKRIRQRPVRSGGSGWTDQTMWVVRSDKDGDGRTKMGTNPDSHEVRLPLE